MQKNVFGFLILICIAVSLPAWAKPKAHFDFGDESEITTYIRSYDNQMIEAAQIAESNAHKRSHRRCWRAVKDAMVEAKVLEDRPTTRYAKQAGEELEQKYGFRKIDITNPFEAPIGSVLVYGGRGAGHVEIRTADGFVSDTVSSHPSRRPLIGVYVRV